MDTIRNFLVKPNITIKQALKKMDESGRKIIFVTDVNDIILGVVTDGDIRRWILKNNPLTAEISKIMNKNPLVITEYDTHDKAKKIMLDKEIECIPVINDKRKIITAIWWIDLFNKNPIKKKQFNLPVVIMAGGEGTRLYPFTKILPKPLVPIGDKPILEIIINRFYEYGCTNFNLSVNYKSNIIKAYFSDFKHNYKINYIHEKKPLGTAGSLHILQNRIRKTFFVSNCDILIDADYADILKFHKQSKNKITLVTSMKHFTIPYGICEIGDGGALKNINEKPEQDLLVNTGLYVLEPEVLNNIPKNTFFQITDLISFYLKSNKKIGVYPVSEKSWIDIGQIEELQNAIKLFGV